LFKLGKQKYGESREAKKQIRRTAKKQKSREAEEQKLEKQRSKEAEIQEKSPKREKTNSPPKNSTPFKYEQTIPLNDRRIDSPSTFTASGSKTPRFRWCGIWRLILHNATQAFPG
jgi:hypothetical protein